MATARLRAIPPAPVKTDPGLRRVLDAITEQLEVLRGLRGSTEQAVTDLTAAVRVLQERVYVLEQGSATADLASKVSGFVSASVAMGTSDLVGGVDRFGSMTAITGDDTASISGTVT